MSAAIHKPLGEILVAEKQLKSADLEHALHLQEQGGDRIGATLHRLGMVSEIDIARGLSIQLGLPLIEAGEFPHLPLLEDKTEYKFMKAFKILPIAETDDELVLAMADPLDDYAAHAVALVAGKRVARRVGIASEIEQAIEQLYGSGRTELGQIADDAGVSGAASEQEDIERLKDLASEAPVIRLVNLLIEGAVASVASDIHIEPFEQRLTVRYRVDGVLREVESPPAQLCAALISRIKIMARLNIAERRLPQDGRIQLRVQGKEIDLRVSTVPTMHGESVVMRILDKASVIVELPALGFSEATRKTFLEALGRPHGIILVTGPTGSGKTTTLYTALHRLNTPEVKILTVEDPVEYYMEGVNQIQVRPQIGLTFASALRSIVRQDPDVIMIGEMRDLETAAIAVQSALTGHLVLSTLHTNDAVSSITRLMDMGVEDYLLSSTIIAILAQRLVRKLCAHCRRPVEALPELVQKVHLEAFTDARPVVLYQPGGCEQCRGSGYQGRMAVGEILVMSEAIRREVLQRADASRIQSVAVQEGMHTMYEDGLQKAVAGLTTIDEVLRVAQE